MNKGLEEVGERKDQGRQWWAEGRAKAEHVGCLRNGPKTSVHSGGEGRKGSAPPTVTPRGVQRPTAGL